MLSAKKKNKQKIICKTSSVLQPVHNCLSIKKETEIKMEKMIIWCKNVKITKDS